MISRIQIDITETAHGRSASETVEFLTLSLVAEVKLYARHMEAEYPLKRDHVKEQKRIIAYNQGNGYVKLFTYQHFLNFTLFEQPYQCEEVSLDLYSSDEFEEIAYGKFFNQPKNQASCAY